MGFKDIEINSDGDDIKLEALEIALTSLCNFNCPYCGAYENKKHNTLDIKTIVDNIIELPDLKRIKLSGGEVTLFIDECLELIRYCKERGIETQINTNGSLLDQKKIDQLAEAGLDYIHISLNHYEAEMHDKYYKKGKETFEKISNNIKYLCKQDKIDVITESILFEEIINNDVKKLYDYVYDLGVRKFQIQTPIPQATWEINQDNSKTIEAIERLINNKHEDDEMYVTCVCVDKNGVFLKNISDEYKKGKVQFPYCIEGKKQLHLHSNGDIIICDIGKPVLLGNIFKGDSLKTVMETKRSVIEEMMKKCDCTTFM